MDINKLQTQLMTWIENDWVKNLLILVTVYIFLSIASSSIKRSINKKITNTGVKLKLRGLVGITFTILFAISCLILFSNKMSGFAVTLGVAGAGIAFALQEVIASLAGWFAIHFGAFYSIGDRIDLAGTKGDVIEIGLLRTTVMELGQWVKGDQYNGRVVRVANSFVFKEPVINYSADFPFLWDEISLPIKYGSNLKKTRQLIKSITDAYFKAYEESAKKEWNKLVVKYVIENAQIDNQIYVTADENWVSFNLRYVTDFKSRRLVKNDLFTNIIEAIENNSDFVNIAGSTLDITGSQDFFKTLKAQQQSTAYQTGDV